MDERSDLFIDKAKSCGRVPVICCRWLRIAKGERARRRATGGKGPQRQDARDAEDGGSRQTRGSSRLEERATIRR